MVKILIANLTAQAGSKSKSPPKSVTEKRVRDLTGQMVTLRTLDAGSQTFGTDLGYVFGKNVAKARRANKKLIGKPDVGDAKR